MHLANLDLHSIGALRQANLEGGFKRHERASCARAGNHRPALAAGQDHRHVSHLLPPHFQSYSDSICEHRRKPGVPVWAP